jgi:hypothetical protein
VLQTDEGQPVHAFNLTCTAIAQDASSLQLLLELLELEGAVFQDFYVRHSTIRLLSRLVAAHPLILQSALLNRQQVRFHTSIHNQGPQLLCMPSAVHVKCSRCMRTV